MFGLKILFIVLLIHQIHAQDTPYGSYHPLRYYQRNSTTLPLRHLIFGNLILHDVDQRFWENGIDVHVYTEEVTGYIHLKNINFNISLRPLAIIHGEELEPETGAALLMEDCGPKMVYLDAPNLQLIKKGKVVIRNCPNLCVWNPNVENGVNYGSLVQPMANASVNSRLSVVNSFQNCKQKRIHCLDGCKQGCITFKHCQAHPAKCASNDKCEKDTGNTCHDLNCAFGCRYTNNRQQCNACPSGLFRNEKNGKCTKCPVPEHKLYPTVGLYCSTPEEMLDEDSDQVVDCSADRTLKDEKCQKCNVDVSDSGVFFASCLKQCKGFVFPNYIYVAMLFPGYSTETYDEDVEYEEHELCGIAHKRLLMGFGQRHPNEWPPLSSLWFMSRVQYAGDVLITQTVNDFLFLNNLRKASFIWGRGDHSIYDMRYIDLGLLDGKHYEAFNPKGHHWFNPLPSGTRFGTHNQMIRKSIKNKLDCRCGFTDDEKDKAECFVPGNCNKCNHGHRQYIDPQTKFMFTRCSQKPHDGKMEFRSGKDDVPPNTIFPCHKTCAPEGCTGKTVFDCKKCKKLDVWTNNMARTCALTCPLGFYKVSDADARCLRCHKACRRGCTGPAAGKGKGGCNDCFSYISAPKDSAFEAICMTNENSNVENLLVVDKIIGTMMKKDK